MMKLMKPTIELKQAYEAYISEWEISGEAIVPLASSRNGKGYEELLEIWEENTTEKAYERGWVPSTLYFMTDEDGKIVGAIHLRHELNEYLNNVGGHTGYGIRPSERKKGYAAKMLNLSLPISKQLGIEKLLVTCDKNNPASAKTILNCGGILENEVQHEGETVQRYWIDLNTHLQLHNHQVISTKEVILFDLDGTLTDPKAGITKSVAYALDSFGIKTNDINDLCCFIGPPLKDSFMNFCAFSEENAVLAIEKYREYFGAAGLFENEIYNGIESLLQRLSTMGRQLIVATSKPKIFADRILEHFNIAQYFKVVCGSEMDGTRTKKSEVIQYALEQADIIDLRTVIMVGDREHDIIGANAVGIDSIGVLYGYGCREEFRKAGATLIAESVEELGKLLL